MKKHLMLCMLVIVIVSTVSCVSLRRPVIVQHGTTEIYTGLGQPGMATLKSDLWQEGYLRNRTALQETIYFPEGFWILVNDSFFNAPNGPDKENCSAEEIKALSTIPGPEQPKCWRQIGRDDFIILEIGQLSRRLRAFGGPHLLRVAYANTGNSNVNSQHLVLTGARPFYINLNFQKRDAPLSLNEQVLYFDWIKDIDYWY